MNLLAHTFFLGFCGGLITAIILVILGQIWDDLSQK